MPSSNRDATNGKDPQGDQGIPSCCVWFAPFGGMWTLIQTLVRHSHISSSGSQRSQRSVPENTTHLMIRFGVQTSLFPQRYTFYLPDRGNPINPRVADQHKSRIASAAQRMSYTSPWPAVLPCAKICFRNAPSFANSPSS